MVKGKRRKRGKLGFGGAGGREGNFFPNKNRHITMRPVDGAVALKISTIATRSVKYLGTPLRKNVGITPNDRNAQA